MDTIHHVFRRLMQEAPGGPLTPSDIVERSKLPRSSVYRHLRTGKLTRRALKAYAEIFNVPESELAKLLGFPSAISLLQGELDVMVGALSELDREERDAIWNLINVFRRGRAPVPSASD